MLEKIILILRQYNIPNPVIMVKRRMRLMFKVKLD